MPLPLLRRLLDVFLSADDDQHVASTENDVFSSRLGLDLSR